MTEVPLIRHHYSITKKASFYDVFSKTVLKDHLRKECGDIFVIQGTNIAIYVAGSKAVTQSRLRM